MAASITSESMPVTNKATETKNQNSLEKSKQEQTSLSPVKAQTNQNIDLEQIPTIQPSKAVSFGNILKGLSTKSWIIIGCVVVFVICAAVAIPLGVVLSRRGVTTEATTTTTAPTTSTTTTACFYGEDQVRLVNGDIKAVRELRSGMKVYSMNDQNEITEDEIIMMLHRDPDETDMFCVIETTDPKYKLSLTCDHYIAVKENSETKYIITDNVKPDEHFVYVNVDSSQNQLLLLQVKNVIRQYKTGLYGLTTNEGTVIVNDIVASCYSNFTTIRIAHNVLGLFRLYYKVAKYFSIEEPFKISTTGIPKPIKALMNNKDLVVFFHDLMINIRWLIEIELLLIILYFIQIIIQKYIKVNHKF